MPELHLRPAQCPMLQCELRESYHSHDLCPVCGGIHLPGEASCILDEKANVMDFPEGCCPFLFCLILEAHTHPICGTCRSVRYGNWSCEECRSHRMGLGAKAGTRSLEKP